MTLQPLQEITETIEKELSAYSPLITRLLVNRGIITGEEAYKFLVPSYDEGTFDPFLLKDLEKAVDRIYDAIMRNEKIAIYADYDCDGVPGAVVMSDFFELIQYGNYVAYIPDRHKEGYGLKKPAIDNLIEQGVQLIITVDLGITNNEEVEYTQKKGVDVIVTDHHLVLHEVPNAYAVIDPKQDDCKYPDEMLCGSGVAYKLIQGFLQKYRDKFNVSVGQEKWLLDMVGLATLSDMVPLVNENRILAHYGMLVFKKTKRKGLLHLAKKAGVNLFNLVEEDITFMISPRINAAGRMDHPRHAYDLLFAKDDVSAGEKALVLEQYNTVRKNLVKQIMKKAKEKIGKRDIPEVIVVGDRTWAVGVLGLVASRLVEEFGRPVFVWGGDEEDTVLKGSCRSDGTVNIVALMEKHSSEFVNLGGHEAAGGFSIELENIHSLEKKLCDTYAIIQIPKPETVEYEYDTELTLQDVDEKTYTEISRLAPFGVGNPKPVFLFRDSLVKKVRLFGKHNEHLELTFENNIGMPVKAIAFFTKHDSFGVPIEEGKTIQLFGSIEKSTFGYKKEIRLRIENIHFM